MKAFAASFGKGRERLAAVATSFRSRFEWLISFLKRRSISLWCVIALLACSSVDFYRWGYSQTDESGIIFEDHMSGLFQGGFIYHRVLRVGRSPQDPGENIEIHSPLFGDLPTFSLRSDRSEVYVPLWLPLAGVLGWLVFRELRWREKRAKAAEKQ
jgi:hypothetical protein